MMPHGYSPISITVPLHRQTLGRGLVPATVLGKESILSEHVWSKTGGGD
jgi:hypothetical protein